MEHRGFTLAELLLALSILAVISTATIPKILQAQSSQKFNSIAKETAGTMSNILLNLRVNNLLSPNTTTADFTPYLNYLKVVTIGSVDGFEGEGSTRSCTLYTCVLLANGSMVHFNPTISFGGTGNLRAIWWGIDPDGVVTTSGGNGNSLIFFTYYNGRIRDFGTIEPNTQEVSWTYPGPCPECNPSWFSW